MNPAATYSMLRHHSPSSMVSSAAVLLLLLAACCTALASCPTTLPTNSPFAPKEGIADLNPDFKADPHASQKYEMAIRELLSQDKFSELDRAAAAARVGKTRFSGGPWVLYAFYAALQEPSFATCGKAKETDWQTQLARLKRWVSLNPQSITARVALADAYVGYAWQIRGNGFADVVGNGAWKPFAERIQLAKDTLDDASVLQQKCPHWFLIMQQVGRAQGWSLEELTALLERAISFEPLYYYYYREHAYTLQPKWYGQEGDAERFADEISVRIDGKQGAMVYFEIATALNCTGCSESKSQFARMSWPKIQQGYAALEELYGTSIYTLNEFAHLAIRAEDRAVALRLFVRIGDNWDRDIWKTKSYFESSKAWAFVPPPEVNDTWKVADNLHTPEGYTYYHQVDNDFQTRHAADIKRCVETEQDTTVFIINMELGKGGLVEDLKAWPPTKASTCLLAKLAHDRFAVPPQAPQWIMLQVGTPPSVSFKSGFPDPGE